MSMPVRALWGTSGLITLTTTTTTTTKRILRLRPRYNMYIMLMLKNEHSTNSFDYELRKWAYKEDLYTVETSGTLNPGDLAVILLQYPWNYSLYITYSAEISYRLDLKIVPRVRL